MAEDMTWGIAECSEEIFLNPPGLLRLRFTSLSLSHAMHRVCLLDASLRHAHRAAASQLGVRNVHLTRVGVFPITVPSFSHLSPRQKSKENWHIEGQE